ncbi:MAG: helix-hairpin-helix domain-containing protein [Chloroflexi bacterium]|nr:helix-hairpin-helix domain-containing protein [Chloroflexota bacterium]
MRKREGKITSLNPAWWIAYGVLCGLGAAGLILLLAAPRRGEPIQLLPAPTRSATSIELEAEIEQTPIASPIPTTSFPININTATAQELERLPGIGPTLAQSIVAYREAHGLFATIDDIQNVPEIGPRTYEGIMPFITVDEP